MLTNLQCVDGTLDSAWRDAVVHLVVKEGWSDGLPVEQVVAAVDEITYKKGYALR
jgi:hypothetical protein